MHGGISLTITGSCDGYQKLSLAGRDGDDVHPEAPVRNGTLWTAVPLWFDLIATVRVDP